MNLFLVVLAGLCVLYARADENHENGCSFHQTMSCHEKATCVDVDLENNVWECQCPDDLDGDGLKGENNTGCGEKECKLISDCHPFATCVNETNIFRCICKTGYEGDGWQDCSNIDECKDNPCHPKADCENTPGSFKCTCDERKNYFGNGTYCEHTCSMDDDCFDNEECLAQVCVCKGGYEPKAEGDGCIDIDECVTIQPCDGNATCTNKDGGVDCDCNNGYRGDGRTCTKMPMNCHDIKLANMEAKSGRYEIDPDYEGPLENIEVQCDMRETFGITIISPNSKIVRMRTSFNYEVKYEYSVEEIKAVVNSSEFCYQYMKYECRWGATLMNGDDYLVDGNGNVLNAFATTAENMCPCGQMTYCRNRTSSCNCDGNSDYGFDEGKLLERELLPITRLVSNPNKGRGDVTMGAVKCAPKPHDFPKNCHDAKFTGIYNIKKDGPQHIDVDGEDGDLGPILVHCDMETEKHVGISVIPTKQPEPKNVTQPGNYSIEYGVTDAHLKELVNVSDSCTQEVGYECVNSALLNNGNPKQGYFWTLGGEEKDYWPTGLGEQYKCGCGVLGNCANESYGCNCDKKDGQARTDYGKVMDKADLPIGQLTFLDLGEAGQSGRYYVGDLRCSQKQFGNPPLCQDYVNNGYVETQALIVDPDGPQRTSTDTENQEPFLVYCEMTAEPPSAATIVYHTEGTIAISGTASWTITYKQAIREQLAVLIDRSYSCTQTVLYSCQNAALHDENGVSHVTWETRDGEIVSYFDGNGERDNVCQCGLTEPSSCTDGRNCNCDFGDVTQRVDAGLLINEADLPMMSVNASGIEGSAELILGPLVCKDLYPNCADLKVYRNGHKLVSEYDFEDGFYTINPNGEQGVEPFLVECKGTATVVPVNVDPPTPITNENPDEPVSKCYEIKYRTTYDGTTYDLTPKQIQALVEKSDHCSQQLDQTCTNAPLTGFSNYSTCDGQVQPGWSGSQGRDKCACGVLGYCKGGADVACNCDTEDGKQSTDGGYIHDKNYLAICEVCVGLDKLSNLDPDVSPRSRRVQPSVSDLICNSDRIGKTPSCMDWRNSGIKESGEQMVDPDFGGPVDPSPIFCRMEVYPPLGISEIKPKEPVIEVPPEGGRINVTYYVYSMKIVATIIEQSTYCTQNVTLECDDASLVVNGTYGFYSNDGVLQTYWAGNEYRTAGCASDTGECNCNLPGFQVDGGLIVDDDYVENLLPVSGFEFGPSTGERTLTVGPLQCFNLPKDCEEIRAKNQKRNPMRNHTYTIDPDLGGGVPYFAVKCDFDTDKSMGITVIKVEVPPKANPITASALPNNTITTIPVTYDSVTHKQIHALAEISGYCFEGIQYNCYKSPLLNFNDPAYVSYTTFGGQNSSSFGTAEQTDASVCACYVTKSCPENLGCHCDAMGPMTTVDYGYLTDNEAMPIEALHVKAGPNPDGSATFDITDVKCAPRPIDLPKDCQDAYKAGKETGEILIHPNPNVDPFLVYCNMDKGFGVAIIRNTLEEGKNVIFGEPIIVDYFGATKEQLEALTEVSVYCYTPFKYECQYTKFLSGDGYFHWNNEKTHVGAGRYYKNECNCGADGQNGQCGGSEDKDYLLNNYRPCNCDAEDGKPRVDAGVFNTTTLPIVEFLFKETGNNRSMGFVTLGKMYCADFDFDLDECVLGFDDCDENAACTNQHGDYKCRCKKGWQGLGRHDVWANGRDCHDDDECAVGDCPSVSNCTNTPGSFSCVCHDGYNQTGPTECVDIDECKNDTLNDCDKNAICYNYEGSYVCACKRNYRGNGSYCAPLAECSCFGDPHCMTSDGSIIDYQGTCQYVMARDGCDNLEETPSYELLIQTADRPEIPSRGQVSYVREALFKLPGYEISLLQGHVVWVNGEKVNLPYRQGDLFHISKVGKYVEVYTSIKVEVVWDGEDFIEIRTPGTFKGQTCGFCGNYNDNLDDDLILGPSCPGAGNLTDNFFKFGNSWSDVAYAVNHPECNVNCTPKEEPKCESIDLRVAKEACNKVWAKDKVTPFTECLSAMNETMRSKFEASCIYDVCQTDGDASGPVCDSAEFLYQECLNMGLKLDSFRDEGFCSMDCKDDNMVYLAAGSVNQPTCIDFLNSTQESPNNDEPQFAEGCFCKDGFVMDVDECVEEEKCGCVYEDQYYKIGEEITLDNCGSKGVCYANHSVIFDDITCDENAECKLKEGRYGCHCKNGYYGDGVTCTEDKCIPTPCGENETCVRNSEKDKGYECMCAMGFIGNCNNCTELDECSTGTDGCPYHAECINTVGSYRCECPEGFYMYDGYCHDVDECKDDLGGEPVCGNNSRCSNKIGSYHCPCCNGFEQDNGTCVEKPGAVGGAICCVCDIDVCNKTGQVCGEDAQTYASIGDMIIANCEKGLPPRFHQQVDYLGPCQSSCSANLCPKYQKCVMDESTGKPTCECETCSRQEMESEEKVCSKDLIIYKNLCEFKQVQCEMNSEVEVYPNMGPCEGKLGESVVRPWSPWSTCSVTCGKGEQTKSREPYLTLTPEQEEMFPLQISKECISEDPCPGGACVTYNCTRNAAECVENINGEPECVCPDCANEDVEPVCGFVTDIVGGPRPITWRTKCTFLAFVCEHNITDFEFMHEGHCGSIPEKCTRVPNNQYLRGGVNNTYVSLKKHSLNKCVGGCGLVKEDCCQPTKKKPVEFELKKGNDIIFVDFEFIEECGCVDVGDEVPAA